METKIHVVEICNKKVSSSSSKEVKSDFEKIKQ